MKRIAQLLVLSVFIASITACHNNSLSTTHSTKATHEQSTLPIISTGEHYRILKDDFIYVHQLFDHQGNLMEEIELQKEATIVDVSENVVCLTYQTGTGNSTQWGTFYNVQSNKRSERYTWILDYTDEKVILGLPDGIVVRSIFDDTYYTKITDFEKNVAIVPDAILYAEFVDSDNTISVTYAEADTYELITEHIKLPRGRG